MTWGINLNAVNELLCLYLLSVKLFTKKLGHRPVVGIGFPTIANNLMR